MYKCMIILQTVLKTHTRHWNIAVCKVFIILDGMLPFFRVNTFLEMKTNSQSSLIRRKD